MAGMPPYQFIPPGHPAGAWAQAMMVQQQAQLAAQAQAQAVAQAQAAQAAAYARQMVQPVAAPTGPMQMPGGPGHSQPVQTGKITRKSFCQNYVAYLPISAEIQSFVVKIVSTFCQFLPI
jgi:hypothetical protein